MNLLGFLGQDEDIFFGEIPNTMYVEFHRDLPHVTSFCKNQNITLRRIDVTHENGKPEMMYYFSDDLGGYTINAIRRSV